MCCPTCDCLGYCAKQKNGNLSRADHRVLRDRKCNDLRQSAREGCPYCNIAHQSLRAFHYDDPALRLEFVLYSQSPAELHCISGSDAFDAIEIYPDPDKMRWRYRRVANGVPTHSMPKSSIRFLKTHFQACKRDHPVCNIQRDSFLPKRVVDISSKCKYRLIEPRGLKQARYATLSYSWGEKGFAMTTSKTLDKLRRGFKAKIMPKAFRDAGAIARSLDIRYLWIDTLCIIQDDKEDWAEEAAKMGDIFAASTITIAASALENPHESLFGARKSAHEALELVAKHTEASIDIFFMARKKIMRGFHAKTGRSQDIDRLDTRAWGLQEKLLSTRMIAFTGAELQWSCRTMKACECHHVCYEAQSYPWEDTTETRYEASLGQAKLWSKVVEAYSTRNLTQEDDRLPALGGLAKKFGSSSGYKYHAGAWLETMVYDLVWQRDSRLHLHQDSYLGPSYSWANAPGAVNFRLARHSYPGVRIDHTRLLGHHIDNVGHGDYGRVQGGSLTIEGYIMKAVLCHFTQNPDNYRICINNVEYMSSKNRREICEFSVDISCDFQDARRTQESSWVFVDNTDNDSANFLVEEQIILLGLFSISHKSYLYQNFLILRRSDQTTEAWTRVGVGSGKIYSRDHDIHGTPQDMQNIQPFEWLSMDFERRGMDFGGAVQQVISLR